MRDDHRWETEAASLARMMQTGDLQAFDRLYDLLAGRALRTAAGILLSAQDAADAAQEAFIRVWSNIDSYHPTRPFAPWFYRILINECRRVLKKRRVFSTLEMIAERPAPTEEVAEIEINEALDRLPERQRMAISLKYLSGLSEKDVAKLMHTTQPAVKSLLTRARDTLRKEFEP